MVDRPVVEVGDAYGNMHGQLSSWANLTMVHRACAVGTGALDVVNPTAADRELLQPGATIQVLYRGRVLQFGFIRQIGETRGAAGEMVSKPAWSDPMCLIETAQAFPNPTPEVGQETYQAGQGPREYDLRRGFTTSVVLGLFRDNIGEGAIPWRRAPGVVTGPDPEAGGYLTAPVASRWDPLLDQMRDVAMPNAVGFGLRTVDRTHIFDAWQVADLSDRVVFSGSNLGPGSWTMTAPSATVVVTRGPREGVDRIVFLVRTEESARQEQRWGRPIPYTHDSRTSVDNPNPAEALRLTVEAVRAEAERKLAEMGETVSAQYEIVGSVYELGVDFRLNDLVGIRAPGWSEPRAFPVREVTERWTSAGRTVTPVVGDYGATSTSPALSSRDVQRALAAIQAAR